jgi:hypothetical protein
MLKALFKNAAHLVTGLAVPLVGSQLQIDGALNPVGNTLAAKMQQLPLPFHKGPGFAITVQRILPPLTTQGSP